LVRGGGIEFALAVDEAGRGRVKEKVSESGEMEAHEAMK